MSSAPHGSRPERVGAILKERIDALGWQARLREEEVVTGWDAAVGPQIAAHARPSHVANRRLTVVTESPVWTQQLSLLKPELLRRIAACFGPQAVTDLFFVTGRIEPPAPAPEPPPPPDSGSSFLPHPATSEAHSSAKVQSGKTRVTARLLRVG
jgi:predicted nucleic acid-binding Zn ribbon protein